MLNESGDPASNVQLTAMMQSPGGHSGGYPNTFTDESGRYCFDGLPFGSYILSGDDEGLGYPMRKFVLFMAYSRPSGEHGS